MREMRSRFEAHWVTVLRDLRGTGGVPLNQAQLELLRREFLNALESVWDAAVRTRRSRLPEPALRPANPRAVQARRRPTAQPGQTGQTRRPVRPVPPPAPSGRV